MTLHIPPDELLIAARLRTTDLLSWVELEQRIGYGKDVLQRNFRAAGLDASPLRPWHRWPTEREQRFRALIAAGVRVVPAGKMVGVGKNAAIGKWHRMRAAEARDGRS